MKTRYLHVSESETEYVVSGGGSYSQSAMVRMTAALCESVRETLGLTPAGMLAILALEMEEFSDEAD